MTAIPEALESGNKIWPIFLNYIVKQEGLLLTKKDSPNRLSLET